MKTVARLTVAGTIHRPDISGSVCRIDVPSADVARVFGRKGRVPIVATFGNGHHFRTSLTPMRGTHILPVNAEMRRIAGLAEGANVSVTLAEDIEERTVEVPDDLAAALATAEMRDVFDGMAYSHRKEWTRALDDAKRPETRKKRISDCVAAMRAWREQIGNALAIIWGIVSRTCPPASRAARDARLERLHRSHEFVDRRLCVAEEHRRV